MVKKMTKKKTKSGSTMRHFPRLPNERPGAYIARAWKSRHRRSQSKNSAPESPSVISPSSPSPVPAGPSSTATVFTLPEPLSLDCGFIELPALEEGSVSSFDADPQARHYRQFLWNTSLTSTTTSTTKVQISMPASTTLLAGITFKSAQDVSDILS